MGYVTKKKGGKAERIAKGIGQALKGAGQAVMSIEQAQRMKQQDELRMQEAQQKQQMFQQQMQQVTEQRKAVRTKQMRDLIDYGLELPSGQRKDFFSNKTSELVDLSAEVGLPWNKAIAQEYISMPDIAADALSQISRVENMVLFGKEPDAGTLQEYQKAVDSAIRALPATHRKQLMDRRKELNQMLAKRQLETQKQAGKKKGSGGANVVEPEEVNRLMSAYKKAWRSAANKFSAQSEKEQSRFRKYVEQNPLVGAVKEKLFAWVDPDIGGFVSSRNAIAKKFVKATDGGRPTDFDFKVWVNRILPNLGVSDEVMERKLEAVNAAMGQLEDNTSEEAARRNFELIENIMSGATAVSPTQPSGASSYIQRLNERNKQRRKEGITK